MTYAKPEIVSLGDATDCTNGGVQRTRRLRCSTAAFLVAGQCRPTGEGTEISEVL